MTDESRTYYDPTECVDLLVGHQVIDTTETSLILDNGMQLRFDRSNSSCCSFVELGALSRTENVIIAAYVEDNEDETGGEGEYRAWIRVLTEATELNVAEAEGNASNGYYLHGFALSVTYEPAPPTDGEVADAIRSIRKDA